MPWVSDKQRRWMFATHPAMARRWAAEEKAAPPSPTLPRNFATLCERGLVGISDRVIKDHLRLYDRAWAELQGIERAASMSPWAPPPEVPSNEIQALLDTPVSAALQPYGPDGSVMQPDGKLAACLSELKDELLSKGISWFPLFYFGDADFWTADRATSINLPWYLATDALWRLVNDQTARYDEADLLRVLRHETGHAVGYAFEIWKRPEWSAAFGDFEKPYGDAYPIDPGSTDFVVNLQDSITSPNAHYAQKHPDEDWAETFATWLDPGSRWKESYAAIPGALAKLEAVELMIVGRGAAYGEPPNTAVGERVPASSLPYTIGEFLGLDEPPGFDRRAELARRAPAVLGSVVLHESYFEALGRGAGASTSIGGRLGLAIATEFGSVDAWLRDVRAICASTDGWMVTSWSPRDRRVRNSLVEGHDRGLPPDGRILLALDMHEHAYFGDVGPRRDLYVGALMRNVDWVVVGARYDMADPPPPIPAPLELAPVPTIDVPAASEVPAMPALPGEPAPMRRDVPLEREPWAIPGQEGP